MASAPTFEDSACIGPPQTPQRTSPARRWRYLGPRFEGDRTLCAVRDRMRACADSHVWESTIRSSGRVALKTAWSGWRLRTLVPPLLLFRNSPQQITPAYFGFSSIERTQAGDQDRAPPVVARGAAIPRSFSARAIFEYPAPS